jgi:hypothetical protein
MKLKSSSRRQMILDSLTYGGAAAVFNNPVAQLLDMILGGVVTTAHAQTVGVKPRKYVFAPLMGGPARWTLTPYCPHPDDLAKMIRNPMVNTRFVGGAPYTAMEYRTVSINGMNWPWLWQFNVARSAASGGGMRPMRDLMNNMMMVRGVSAVSAHGPAQVQRYHPMNIPFSFGSLVTDVSAAAIPAINSDAERYRHISRAGRANVNLTFTGNLLTQLLDGLRTDPKKFYTYSRGSVSALMRSVTADLETAARAESAGFDASTSSLKSAEDAIQRGFGDLGTIWPALVNKYRDLCVRTVKQTLAGINDQPIGAALSSRGPAYTSTYEGRIIQNTDLRTVITDGTAYGRIAENFALAEFVLLNNISDNIALGMRHVAGMNCQGCGNFTYYDEHNSGSFVTLLANTFGHMTLAACLLELTDRLKAANLFNEVLIDVSGEMGRNPGHTQSGSDHGGQALDISMWSGAFPTTPSVIGNVLAQPPASYRYAASPDARTYPGSWGYGASNPGVGIITLGHIADTQAHILRVEKPVRSAASLVSESNGKFVPILGVGRTIT